MYNFSELKTKTGELTQRSGDTDYLAKIGTWLQMSHKTLGDIYDYWLELRSEYNFTSVDGREDYPMPNDYDKPFRLYDITNDKKIVIQTQEEYFDGNIANIADAIEGTPSFARPYGVLGVRVPIASTGDTVQVKSSSASDSGGIIIRIEGYIDSAHLIRAYENITISTASPTTYVAGTTTFYKITHISKSANTVGYVTIANSSGTVLETMATYERVARHVVFKLGLIPNVSTINYRMLYKKVMPELVNDYDYPFTECDRYLIMNAAGWAFKQDKEDSRAELVWGRAAEALRALLNKQNDKLGPDYQHKIVSAWLSSHNKIGI